MANIYFKVLTVEQRKPRQVRKSLRRYNKAKIRVNKELRFCGNPYFAGK